MNLVKELALEKAHTTDVRLVPTERFFKPVLTISAPLDQYNSELIGAQYLFDRFGNPRDFEGSHKLPGELAAPELLFKSDSSGEFRIKTEQVAHFSCYHEDGMRVRFRAHLGEDEDALGELLKFLAKLNKDPFGCTVYPAQKGFEFSGDGPGPGDDPNFKYPEPNEEGEYSIEQAARRPTTAKHGEVHISTIGVEAGYISGWTVNWKHQRAAGELLTTKRPVCVSERAAMEQACIEAYAFIMTITPKDKGERESRNKLIQALLDMYPEVARESAREAAIAE